MITITSKDKEGNAVKTVLSADEQQSFIDAVIAKKTDAGLIKPVDAKLNTGRLTLGGKDQVEKPAKDLTTVTGTEECKIRQDIEYRIDGLKELGVQFQDGKITVGEADYTPEDIAAMSSKDWAKLQSAIAKTLG